MPQHSPLIATIVIGIGLAFVLGAIANRLRISPLVGYVLAGVVVGPHTPGFVADQAMARELAEIGVILLMFGVGLHFSLKDLLSVRRLAIPGALAGIALATMLGVAVSQAIGWNFSAGVMFGVSISVASTVVLTRALQERRLLKTEWARAAVGWLVVEDLAMVLALVLMPALAALNGAGEATSGGRVAPGPDLGGVLLTLGITLGKVAGFIVATLVIGRRVIPWILHYIAHTGSRELFRLAVLTAALGVAFGAALLFDVSFALGAFLAGMILSESQLSQRAADETLPLRDAFAVLFFVSVGMLIDPAIIVRDPGPVIATVAIILLGKPVLAFFIMRAFRHGPMTALTMAASLAQIGEFSFIVAGLAVALGIMPVEGRDYMLAGAIITILFNPLWFLLVERFGPRLEQRLQARYGSSLSAQARSELRPTMLSDHAVVVGGGRVGGVICEGLRRQGTQYLVIEERQEKADALRAQGVEVLCANAAEAIALKAANVAGARLLFVAIPNGFEAGQIVAQASAKNPLLRTVVRAHSDDEVAHLRQLGAKLIVLGETEIATGMLDVALAETDISPPL